MLFIHVAILCHFIVKSLIKKGTALLTAIMHAYRVIIFLLSQAVLSDTLNTLRLP